MRSRDMVDMLGRVLASSLGRGLASEGVCPRSRGAAGWCGGFHAPRSAGFTSIGGSVCRGACVRALKASVHGGIVFAGVGVGIRVGRRRPWKALLWGVLTRSWRSCVGFSRVEEVGEGRKRRVEAAVHLMVSCR